MKTRAEAASFRLDSATTKTDEIFEVTASFWNKFRRPAYLIHAH